jgi:hypothetical protein
MKALLFHLSYKKDFKRDFEEIHSWSDVKDFEPRHLRRDVKEKWCLTFHVAILDYLKRENGEKVMTIECQATLSTSLTYHGMLI